LHEVGNAGDIAMSPTRDIQLMSGWSTFRGISHADFSIVSRLGDILDGEMSGTADIGVLLQHSTWMRRLAMSLVRDDAAADDLVQETWVAALKHPPRAGDDVRPWLGKVLRNLMRGKHRSESRRNRREDAATEKGAHAPSTEHLVGAVEVQRLLAEEVLALKEPYISTILLCFYEGLSASEVALRLDVAASTVRWRVQEGLKQLRVRLDRKHAGDRSAWLRAMAPLASDHWGRVAVGKGTSIVKGAWQMKIGAAVVTAGIATALFAVKRSTNAQPTPASAPPVISAHPQTATAVPVAPALPARRSRVEKSDRADLLKRFERARLTPVASGVKTQALDKDYIKAQIRELMPMVKECYESALSRNPKLNGKLVVRFSIVGDPSLGGIVSESKVVDGDETITDHELSTCVQETMYAARFPPPKEGGEVSVEYPFVFKTSDEHHDKE
jgi:RNA polymerase sigma factor (sigma-70 family)